MTEDELLAILKQWQNSDDTESAHANADEALEKFLYRLGYHKVVQEYRKIAKWYA